MYLKRLDIQGFKSFANKMTMVFGPGVTCVVGPNGTGKTNVADSLRWVLGEHARASLRARKTEDVIFAGSEKRSPLGVAEVNIALDNSEHWLPIDFDEVVVTRRAYRNGENEYLINHARVRLRDVVELFQRAQVGQNSYAFMGQGMVEQALSLRPEDRRALIEEAADVRVYRTKLEDARNKLKATRENVERVRLLVREIEPRITQLERQAGRAVRYRELTQELAATLHVWYAHQWRDVNEQLLAAHTSEEQCAEEFERAKAEAKACEDGLTQLRAAIDERRREIESRESRLRGMRDYVADLEQRVALDSERRQNLLERVEELTVELHSLRHEQASIDDEAPPPDTSELEARLAEVRAQLNADRDRASEFDRELRKLHRTALDAEQAAARARATSEEMARRLKEADASLAQLTSEQASAAEARRAAVAEVGAWARDYLRLREVHREAAAALDSAMHQRAAAAQAAIAARRGVAEGEDAVRELRATVETLRARMQVLERIDLRPQAPDAGVRAILEAGGIIPRENVAADVELSGVVGLLGQLLRVPAGLERAIEAALAENLFAVVFQRESDLRAAVALLLDGDRGRATMYALDNFQESRPLHLIKERGVVGVASGLVRCESRYRRLVDTLLGRTVVVEGLPLAQRFVRRGLAHAIATTDGVLLRPVGAVAAGSTRIVQAAMALEREGDDIPAELARIEPELNAREAALREHLDTLNRSQRRADELETALEELRARSGAASAALAGARTRLATHAAALRAITSDSRRRDGEIERLAQVRGSAAHDHEAFVREALASEEKERESRRSIADLEGARTRLADSVAEQAATVAQLDGQLRAEHASTAGERAARERLVRQIATKDEQHKKFETDAHTIGQRLEATQRELSEKSSELDTLRKEMTPAREEVAQFESRERSLSAELVEANGRLHDAERGLRDAKHDVQTREEELVSLRVSLESEGFVVVDGGDVERAPEPEAEGETAAATAGDGSLPGWLRTEGGEHIPTVRGGSTINATEVRDRIADLRAQIRALGPVNEQAASDYGESRERYDFLTSQLTDLQQAEDQLTAAIDELEGIIRERFRETFKVVNREFERYFTAFFRGGTARLELGETDDDGMPGVDIYAQPPGKKLGSLALLSGGERSLTAVALLFALLQANPSPICVLDEVDAALDEANVGRFVDELRALSAKTQFIIITHNRRTIENADTIYGVSMGADSVSKVLSLKLSDVKVPE
jgi:chromosome segregation protein